MSVSTTTHVNFRGQACEALVFYQSVFGGELSIALQGTDGDEIRPLWNELAASANHILVPLAPASFAPLYGMLTDRYGITWIVGADSAPTNN